MENISLVKTEQETSSVDSDARNDYHLVNTSSPLSSPNATADLSGKTGPSVITTEASLLASFMQDTQSSEDLEILKNCETKWLRLFRLVEKQCQDQIIAQQKVFHHQIHRIQNEIKHLVKLQNQNVCSCTKQNSPVKFRNDFTSLESQMGLQSKTFEENELFVSQLKSSSSESRPEASAVHQECLANSVSTSSGYGTCSAAELSPNKYKDVQMGMENTEEITKGQDSASSPQEDLVTTSIPNKRESTQATVKHGPSVKDDTGFPAEFVSEINEGQCGKTNCKPLTSWAQKMKQNQLKRTTMEGDTHPVQGGEQMQTLTLENTNHTAAVPPSYTFYLSQPEGSQNSLVSDTSGMTYWKLDEKNMYHSLPENFGNEFSILPAKVSSEQSSGDEMKPSSLKDIYHKKQRENQQLVDWNFSPLQSTHPPEILTLDPTLHMKPGEQNPGLPLHTFYGTAERVSLSPDSMADPAFFMSSDTDTFSHISTVTSPQSVGSPKYTSSTVPLDMDAWSSCTFQNETSKAIVNMEDEDNLTLTPSSAVQSQIPSDISLPEFSVSVTCAEDPVVFSKIRQNLREKHARHIADLRAYYDAEIQSLKQQLEISHKLSSQDLKKINQNLVDRCDHLEAALNESNNRMQDLETKNNTLEMEVTDWRDRFCAVSNTAKALQERIEEMRTSSKEKDNSISRLKRRLKDLEEAFEKAYKLSDNKDARLKEENKMFQNLLGEYESLGKEHERVKDTLNVTENKLLDAHTQISDLKRTVSKLEAQIKQLEHENILKFRHLADTHFRTSYANKLAGSDVSRRKWLIPGSEYSMFTGQPLEAQDNLKDNRLEETYTNCRHHSPPEKDSSPDPSPINEIAKKEARVPETPIIKAFKELEERKALKNWGTQTGKEEEEEEVAPAKATTRRPTVGFDETALNASQSPEKGKDQLRNKRYSSPGSQRSSSLPPSNRKSNTPTARREIMLTPIAVTYSPKRSPKENLSPGFSHLLSKNENMMTRFDVFLDDLEMPTPASQYSNPRKRLQFRSAEDTEGEIEFQATSPGKGSHTKSSSCTDPRKGLKVAAWEEENPAHTSEPCLSLAAPAPYEADFKYISRIKTLAETERLFDELTHEKQQIEAQLSRIPCAGGRMTLQARLNQEALEDRLERINRELGSIRMILKKFHVLRTSANI
ncbi:M-phase phosphoprotein 9 isoform X3 [Sceloporus undulatus]|uniref:M-phase phosphoprotein 9 isoform X3 n=1 Tax=Sceloporus undulatus TaxID=8520 RepID=UPI001C4D3752|nr:M-phase phosphoprotein 9 isoform X3 [Sceloporus undulatus]XP_042297742.1 M-phase phosphoprotein 9 isoform X3 [Sceloporus undulatus]